MLMQLCDAKISAIELIYFETLASFITKHVSNLYYIFI